MNRVRNTGITYPKPYFSESEGLERKAELDRYLDKKMAEWKRTVPFASHFTDKDVDLAYYRRTLFVPSPGPNSEAAKGAADAVIGTFADLLAADDADTAPPAASEA